MTARSTLAGPGQPVDAPAAAVGARYAELEGYRGIAALAIVVYHVYQYAVTGDPGLFTDSAAGIGTLLGGLDALVNLFFVLSAFLLTLPYARSALAGQRAPSGRAFLVRRAARVVPLYLVAVLVVWAFRNPVLPGDWADLVQHLTFTQVFDDERIFFTIGPAWSLAVEVHFYLLLAVLGHVAVRACARLSPPQRLRLLVGGLVLLGVASLVWKGVARWVLDRPGDDWSVWFGLPAKLDVFVLGMLLAVAVATGGVALSQHTAVVLRVLGGVALVLAFVTRPGGASEHVWFHSATGLAFALLLASSVLGPQDRWVRLLGSAVPAFLGLVSYSLYLWHEPVLLALADLGLLPAQTSPLALPLGLLVTVPLSLLVAWLSYWVVEWPTSHLRVLVDRTGRPRDYYDGS